MAKDVLQNFIERWRQQGTRECPAPSIDDYFLSSINVDAVAVLQDPSQEWNVQTFRHSCQTIFRNTITCMHTTPLYKESIGHCLETLRKIP